MFRHLTIWLLHLLIDLGLQSVSLKTKNVESETFLSEVIRDVKLNFTSCLVYNSTSKTVESLLKVLNSENMTVIVSSDGAAFASECQSFIFLEIQSSSICALFAYPDRNYVFNPNVIIFVDSILSLTIKYFETCFDHLHCGNVILASLEDEAVFVLSSLSRRKHFIPTSSLSRAGPICRGFKGHHVRVTTFHYPPFVEIERNNGSVTYRGVEMNLWKDVASYLNLNWSLVKPEGSRWGEELDNGTVVGGIPGALETNIADVALANIWQRPYMLAFSEYGPDLNTISITFLVHRPHRLTDRWMSLIQIFHWLVWLSTLLALVAASLTYWTINRSMYSTHSPPSLTKSVLAMFGVLTVSSYQVRSSLFSLRVLAGSWYYFTLLFTNTVMSLIVTKLALPSFSPRIDSIQQLVENNYYWTDSSYKDQKESLTDFYFDLQDPWQKQFERKYTFMSPSALREYIEDDLRNGESEINLALPVQRWGTKDLIIVDIKGISNGTNLDNYRVMKIPTRDAFTAFVFRKRFYLNEILTRTIQWFKDNGLMSYWRKQIDKKVYGRYLLEERDIVSLNGPEQLTFVKLYPVFALLITGLTMACLVFFIELFYRSVKH